MNRFIKFFYIILIAFFCSLLLRSNAHAEVVGDYRLLARGAIAIDFETGTELFAYNADVLRAPASMTKMMTVYLVYEAISQGKIDFDTVVPISSRVEEFSRNPNETNVYLSRTGTYTVDELLDVTIAISAGGATRALAELVGGTQSNFLNMMNAKAAEWDADASFLSPSGGSNLTVSPRGMAIITRNSLLEFPEILEKTSMPVITFKGSKYESTNLLFGRYEGIDGYKTGTNDVAGANFAGTAERDGVRIITVVMGSTWSGRFRDTSALLDYGFTVMEEYHKELALVAEQLALERAAEAARIAELKAAALEVAQLHISEAAKAARTAALEAAVVAAEEAESLRLIAEQQDAIRRAQEAVEAERMIRIHEATTSDRHFIEIFSIFGISILYLIIRFIKKNKN